MKVTPNIQQYNATKKMAFKNTAEVAYMPVQYTEGLQYVQQTPLTPANPKNKGRIVELGQKVDKTSSWIAKFGKILTATITVLGEFL